MAPSRYRSHPPSSPISCFGPRGAETAALGIRLSLRQRPIGGTIVGPAITYLAPTGACHDHDTLHDNRWRCALRDSGKRLRGTVHTRAWHGQFRLLQPLTQGIDKARATNAGIGREQVLGASSSSWSGPRRPRLDLCNCNKHEHTPQTTQPPLAHGALSS